MFRKYIFVSSSWFENIICKVKARSNLKARRRKWKPATMMPFMMMPNQNLS